jgi:hypothetical protein
MKIDKLVSQLNEAVKKRTGIFTQNPPQVGHPDFPIKGVTPEMITDYVKLKKELKSKEPNFSDRDYIKFEDKLRRHPVHKKLVNVGLGSDRSVYRGKIKGSSDSLYRFRPKLSLHPRTRIPSIAPAYSEHGTHSYDFITKDNKGGSVDIIHGPAPKKLQRKGIMTTSDIGFSIEDNMHKTGEEGHSAVGIFRSILPALRHHIRSLNPDQITFSSSVGSNEMQKTKKGDVRNTRKTLYDRLAKKLSKTHDIKVTEINTPHHDYDDMPYQEQRLRAAIFGGPEPQRPTSSNFSTLTKWTLTKKKQNNDSLRTALKMLDKERIQARRQLKNKTIREGKEEEWNAKYDQLSDRGGLSHEQIIRQIGEKPSSPQPEQAPPTRTLTGRELLRQRAKKAAEIALKRKQSGD